MDDRELLRDYVERQSEPAFAELVARHVNLVYATALRIVGEPAAAQDVAQTVFILLARKAWTVRDGNALLGWLYRAAYRAALDYLRHEKRRRQRETEAMILTEQNSTSPEAWEKLAPLLDEAMQRLNRAEQDAVLLRYFEGKTLRETGAALGVSEPAAQMRVSRALDKMRAHFAREGVTVAVGALATVLATNTSKAAPVDLAARVTGPSLAGAGAAGIGGILWRALYMSTKTKIIVAVVILVMIAAVITIGLQRPGEPHLPSSLLASTGQVVVPTVPTPVAASKPNIPAGVEAPVIPPAQPQSPQPPDLAAPAPAPGADPHDNLNTALADMARLIRTGDRVGLEQAYDPPEELAKIDTQQMQQRQALQATRLDSNQNPEVLQYMQKQYEGEAQAYESLAGLTPTYNDTGNEATYTYTMATMPPLPGIPAELQTPQPRTLVMVKINGKWYAKGL